MAGGFGAGTVGVGTAVGSGVGVTVGVAVAVGVDVGVLVGAGVGVAVGAGANTFHDAAGPYARIENAAPASAAAPSTTTPIAPNHLLRVNRASPHPC
jgi:hypothetical protein